MLRSCICPLGSGCRPPSADSSPPTGLPSDRRHSTPGGAPVHRSMLAESPWEAELRAELADPAEILVGPAADRLIEEAAAAIDSLRTARTRIPLLGGCAAAPPREEDTRRANRSRLAFGLGLHFKDAVEIPSPILCLQEVLHSSDTLHAGRRVNVEPYEESRVIFLGADHRTVPLLPSSTPRHGAWPPTRSSSSCAAPSTTGRPSSSSSKAAVM